MLSVANFTNSNLNMNLIVFKDENESLYFPARYTARKLGYADLKTAIRILVSLENKISTRELTRDRKKTYALKNQQPHENNLTESGLYELAFGSKLHAAVEFKKWLSKNVIPSIRRTGAYHLPGALPKFRAITDADFELIMDDEQQVKDLRKEMDQR